MNTKTVGSAPADNAVVSESVDEKKGVDIQNNDDDGELPGLGACILAFFAMTSLLLGAFMTWITVYLINKYLFNANDIYFQAAILALWTGLIFAMTPTFGNAHRVKTLCSKKKG